MATITSAQSGLASATSTWVGGVLPVVGDKAVIAAGHTVTVDGTYHWGDDTLTGITVNGTLRASRTVNSQLTCRGDLYVNHGGTLDYGTEADPIPANVTATILINDSAVMAHNKWGVRTENTAGAGFAGFRIWGDSRTPVTALTADHASTSLSVLCDDVTGWLVGDFLAFEPPQGAGCVFRAISGITPGVGTSGEVTLSAPVGVAGEAGRAVMNLTRNVSVRGVLGQTWRTHIAVRIIGPATDRIELGPFTFACGGGHASNTWQFCGLNLNFESGSTAHGVKKIEGPVHCSVISITGSTVVPVSGTNSAYQFFGGRFAPFTVDSIYGARAIGDGRGIQLYNGSAANTGPDTCFIGYLAGVTSGYGIGSQGCTLQGRFLANVSNTTGECVALTFEGADLNGAASVVNGLSGGYLKLNNCRIGIGGRLHNDRNSFVFGNGTLYPVTISNPTTNSRFAMHRINSGMSATHAEHHVTVLQENGDPAANQRWSRGGRVHRDATRTRRSTGSICLASWYSANVLSMPLSAKVGAGETLRIKGSVWIESAYLPGDAPGIQLSGTMLTTVSWSAPAVADAWHDFDLSIVNTNAYPTDVAITLTARSNANTEAARVWFDGLFADPWSGSVRHHGFQWLPQTALLTDTRITLAEAAALALPVAVDHIAQTIAVTGAVSARQVFEACMADLAQVANISRAVHIASATGDSFETTYTVTTSGAGVITGAYVDATGRRVTISAPALIAGSRVQVYDLTAATELYNGVLASQGLLLPVTRTADRTLRLRADHADMLPMETVAVLGSSGATFLDIQAADAVYVAKAIDGSTVTELAADLPNIQIDITDPGGLLNVWRLYAWAQWYQTTAEGIASDFFGAITAPDEATILIDQGKADIKLDNVHAAPVRVIGGYLARKDGSTVIAANSGSIQMDPRKAYLAGADGLARESTVQAVLAVALR